MSEADSDFMSVKDADIPIHYTKDRPSMFIDGMQGMFNANGIVKIGLYQLIPDPDGEKIPVKKVIFSNLTMTPGVLIATAKWLTQMADEVQKDAPGQQKNAAPKE